MDVAISLVSVNIPDGCNVIIGHAHFIKTVEDLYEALIESAPSIQFGIAFCEAS
ncbi:MAG: adenosine-specific kinase, partial [Candidatus Micrarchaeia archaeon]